MDSGWTALSLGHGRESDALVRVRGLRTHGRLTANEIFSYGPQTPTLLAYDQLRSRLLPYTYSLAWKVTNQDYTIQRPLVMDWRTE